MQDKYDARSMLEWYRHDAKGRSVNSMEAMDWIDAATGRPEGSVQPIPPLACLRQVDAEREGIAFVPAHSFPVTLYFQA